MQTPRPYQVNTVDAVMHAVDPFGLGLDRVLYTQATGCGKTTTFAELVRLFLEDGKKVLILAHRTELITQGYERVKDHCELSPWDIGTEIGQHKAHGGCRVIIGSVQTCMRKGRPIDGWEPDVIITDEAHHSAAKKSYGAIYERYGVYAGRCIHIGCTATAKRTDRLSLYARKLDGSPVMLERKGKPPRAATEAESVFQQHVYDYGMLPAVEEGWLTPILGHIVETDTDINSVETDRDGDFKEGQLAAVVDNEKRTLMAINAWEKIARDRPTLVFCASVEHAHHSAELFRQAGITAAAVDGKTENYERARIFKDFAAGDLQVITNMGVATEGTDLPTCACIIHLRPTKSWNLYVQMSGRGTRALPGVLDGLQDADPQERLSAIAASAKPNCYVIDLVDLYEKCGDLCSVPSILDLPVKLDLQGHSLTEAKKLLDEFAEVKDRVIGECPTTYRQLEVRLSEVNLMRRSGAKSQQDWKATDTGFRYMKTPPAYTCEMIPNGESYQLLVKHRGETILDKTGKPEREMKAYLDSASQHAVNAIDAHRAAQPKVSRGTLTRLSPKQANVLRRNGHSSAEIDTFPYAKAKALIQSYMERYNAVRDLVSK